MNTAKKGADAERELRRLLEKDGCLVIRAAASKGPFDLIAFRPIDKALPMAYCVRTDHAPIPKREQRRLAMVGLRYGLRVYTAVRRGGPLKKGESRWKIEVAG